MSVLRLWTLLITALNHGLECAGSWSLQYFKERVYFIVVMNGTEMMKAGTRFKASMPQVYDTLSTQNRYCVYHFPKLCYYLCDRGCVFSPVYLHSVCFFNRTFQKPGISEISSKFRCRFKSSGATFWLFMKHFVMAHVS